MLSKEITEAINILRKGKEESKKIKMTPVIALKDRNRIDEILGCLPQSQNVTHTKKLSEGGFEGELYTYDKTDSEKLNGKVLLFLHGGGFINGSVLSRRKLCHNIMDETKIDALSVEYEQWPEGEHPQALNNCVAAYRWLLENDYDNKDIYIFGESAGAMLTLTMTLYLKNNNVPLPGKSVIFSPVSGQKIDLPSHSERDERDPMISYDPVIPYYMNSDLKSPYVSPYYGDYTGFPKLAIHVGTEEVLYDDAILIYKKCKESGVDVTLHEWEGLFHVFPLFQSPETDLAIKEIGSFFKV